VDESRVVHRREAAGDVADDAVELIGSHRAGVLEAVLEVLPSRNCITM
jgi:hypothetical protein